MNRDHVVSKFQVAHLFLTLPESSFVCGSFVLVPFYRILARLSLLESFSSGVIRKCFREFLHLRNLSMDRFLIAWLFRHFSTAINPRTNERLWSFAPLNISFFLKYGLWSWSRFVLVVGMCLGLFCSVWVMNLVKSIYEIGSRLLSQ